MSTVLVSPSPTSTVASNLLDSPEIPLLTILKTLLSLLRPLYTFISLLFSLFLRLAASLLSPLSLLISPLNALLYILAPITATLQLGADVLVVGPYKIGSAFLEIIYPLYVFVGVCCIVGAMVGLGARGVASVLATFAASASETTWGEEEPEEEDDASDETDENDIDTCVQPRDLEFEKLDSRSPGRRFKLKVEQY